MPHAIYKWHLVAMIRTTCLKVTQNLTCAIKNAKATLNNHTLSSFL